MVSTGSSLRFPVASISSSTPTGGRCKKTIDLSIEATSYAHSQGWYTVFFPIDSNPLGNQLVPGDLIEKVATEGHMDALAVVDTFGVLSPHATSYSDQESREPNETSRSKLISMWISGSGITNTILALAAGAKRDSHYNDHRYWVSGPATSRWKRRSSHC